MTNNKPNAKAYENITNELYSDALLKTKLNDATINPQGLMWDNPLLGIYVNNYVGNDYQALLPNIKQYETIVEQLKANDELLFTYHIASANLYKLKARYTMLNNYDSGKIEKIEAFEDEVGATNQLLLLKFIGLGYSMRPY